MTARRQLDVPEGEKLRAAFEVQRELDRERGLEGRSLAQRRWEEWLEEYGTDLMRHARALDVAVEALRRIAEPVAGYTYGPHAQEVAMAALARIEKGDAGE